ncbi:MAG: aminopeptidase, partial [Atopobiaceae bacterium]|nr:aminopeptidase [Atopobiaceae bacterium]
MTYDELHEALEALAPKLDKFAELLVKKGVALQEGQELVVTSPVETADFARRVAKAGYEAGARHVTIIWSDDVLTRLDYENAPLDFFEHTPSWKAEQMNSLAAQGACFLSLLGSDPAAFNGVDPEKPAAAMLARNTECDVWRRGIDLGDNAWSICGVAVRSWAQRLFPELDANEALYKLWTSILSASRADGEDPIADWDEHDANFAKNRAILNDFRFDRLHYTSSNGTDLVVGLPKKHLWGGGS